MKLHEKEINFFKSLHQTEVGKSLVDYLDRLGGYICDSRNWNDLGIESKEVANSAERVIKQFITDKIRLQTKMKPQQVNEME